jgi:hypothetical protein
MDLVFLFYVTVWKMRQAQIAFFKERKRGDLINAKRYEDMVDAELKKRLTFEGGVPTGLLDLSHEVRPTDQPKQANLFTGDDNEAK